MTASNRVTLASRALRRGLAGGSAILGLGCLLLLTGASASAHAEPDPADSERANLLFKKGKLAFNDGKYSDALRIYSEAWQLKQSPDIAANLAQTESELGKHRDAAEHYAFALAHLLPSSTDEQKKALAEGLEVEKKAVGTLHVTLEPEDASLSVDGAVVALPATGDLFVDPGAHQCSVNHEGYEPNQQSVSVSKGRSQVLWIKLDPVGGSAAAAKPIGSSTSGAANPPGIADTGSSGDRSLVPVFVGGGIAVVGLAAGVGFLLSGNSHGDKAAGLAAKIPNPNGCSAGSPYPSCSDFHSENQSAASAR